ncbi:dynein associated protein-domain-containing protein [Podospora australis]|uniref:Dynein associated protein-domain-containing protein n=1 Tax=Podospora australis TaxID=1536484 RepID=A0AAN6WV67_9PEZI|nr:dynein associated protein-domain-containing protein [Podospora australis]
MELAVGQKIQLSDGRNGTIRYVGQTHFAQGEWVGVELDEGTGKNDGMVQGERYFDCAMGYGMFVRPVTVTVTAQAPPPPKPAAAAAGPKRPSSRPSSLFSSSSGKGNASSVTAAASSDPGLGKRMSLNAPSPSPIPRRSSVRSPTKSPTKQLGTAPSSAVPSRTGTPSNAGPKPTLGAKPRPASASRTSMAPPPVPGARQTRQVSAAGVPPRQSSAPARPPGGRVSSAAAARPGPGSRPPSGRQGSTSSLSSMNRGTGGRGTDSPRKSSDDEILSPQPTSPVHARAAALEKLVVNTSAISPVAAGTNARSPAAASSSSRNAPSSAAAQKEIEDLKAKLRVLEKKRMDDREKLNSLEKIKGERDKFERIIQTLQIKFQPLQQENADLRKQLKEAEQRFYAVEDMQAEHDTALELATLDREMAEETAEVLRVELDALKQKAEEMELEVEILREENSEFTKGMSTEERASTGWLQMERNNERLREALIRLRDLSQEQEAELKDQIKGLEEDLREFETVNEQYKTTKEKLTQVESVVEDLREQLNNALGAEDLIEKITEENMNQAEEIKELKAVIDDLESLKEINDELEINHVQNEKEMQEELDLKDAVIAEQVRQANLQREATEDMEYTLSRFRELVTSLQSDLEDMRASHAVTENESEQLNSRSRAMLELNMKLQISAAKAQVKTIDLELRRMEAQEAEQHLEIVKLFLPDTYQSDRDSVLALLRFKRLAFKANLLNGFIKERVNGQAHPGHEDDIFEGCGAIDKLTWVSAMCDRFVNAIGHCTLEQFAKYEGALYELEPVERALNGWIDGLRRDDLKEKQCSAELQRTIALMSHLGEVHISNDLESFADDIHMKALLTQSRLESAATTFTALRAMVQRVVPANEEENELEQYFSKKSESVITQTRNAKVLAAKTVRSLEDLKSRSLSLVPDTLEAFEQCEAATQELAEMARRIGLDLHQLVLEEGRTEPYTYAEIQNCIQQTAINSFSTNEADLFSTYLMKLRTITSQISELAALSTDLAQTQEFERSQPPWLLRSQELKALKKIPVDAEEELRRLKDDINDARRAIAIREEHLSTAQVKIETLESRMRDANAKASRITELEAQIENAKNDAASLADNIKKQDRELKALEAERDKWKQIASSSRVVTAADGEAGTKANQERAVATAREMDALKSEISGLQSAVRYLREDNRRARLTEQASYDWLAEPLTRKPPATEQRKAMVVAESKAVLGELLNLATSAKVLDLDQLVSKDAENNRAVAWKPAKSTPQFWAAKQEEDYANWKSWEESVLRKSKLLTGRPGTTAVEKAAERSRRNKVAARLQIRLPGAGDGKKYGREVQIVGSREWEGLQGRVAFL